MTWNLYDAIATHVAAKLQPLLQQILELENKNFMEIDDLKKNVSDLTASQATFNGEMSKVLADIQAKLSQPAISPADVETAAQALGTLKTQVDANTQTLTSFDATLNPTGTPAA